MSGEVQASANHEAANLGPEVSVTSFPNITASSKSERSVRWHSFVQMLAKSNTFASKARCPLIKLATFGDKQTAKGSLRHDENVVQVFGIEGDYDDENVSLDDAEELLRTAGIESLIYTTPSYTDKAPRWRVIAPLSKPVAPAARKQYVDHLNRALGGILAKESFVLSQCFYAGRVEGVHYEVRHIKGSCINLLPSYAVEAPVADLPTVSNGRETDEELIRQVVAAENYHEPLLVLTARYNFRGMTSKAIIETLKGIVLANNDESPRRQARLDDIERMVDGAVQKFPVNQFGDIRHGSGDVLPLTEIGNSDRMAAMVGSDTRFIPEADCWLLWDRAWVQDDGMTQMTAHAKKVVEKLYAEATELIQSGRTADAMRVLPWALKSQTRASIDTTITLLSRQPHLRLSVTQLDNNPWIIGLDEGRQVIELKSGVLRAATRDDYVTKSLGVASLGNAEHAVNWRHFLATIFESDMELVQWFQRWCGYLLTGQTTEQCLLFLYGLGKNGKSVLMNILMAVLGKYSRAIAGETLVANKRDSQAASPDLARLVGARLVTSVETDDGYRLAESLIKSMTGGDKITARFLHKEFFEYVPTFKLMIAGNHKPLVAGTDHGMWRRIHLVPFTKTFSDEEADPQLTDKLRAELPHIAAWMVEGVLAWQKQGLGPTPKRVRDATLQYRDEMDTIGEFLTDRCVIETTAFISSAELFIQYDHWCADCGLRPPTRQAFGRKLIERAGIVADKVKNVRGFRGVRLSGAEDNWSSMV